MQAGFTAEVTRVEDFEEVEFAAAGGPAGAGWVGTVLGGVRDLGVEEPDGGHVGVEDGVVAGAGEGHGELDEEDFGGGGEAIWIFGDGGLG